MSCPFKGICEKGVSYEFFDDHCDGYSYRSCKEYRELKSKSLKPREWERKLKRKTINPYNPYIDPWLLGHGCCCTPQKVRGHEEKSIRQTW